MAPTEQASPKDAGLLVMLFLVVVGTLIMAWVADHQPQNTLPAQAVEAHAEAR